MPVLRNLDLLLLALAIGVFLAADLPLLGWLVGAGIWALWRGIGLWTDRRLKGERDPKTTAGIAAGSLIGRGWLLGLILLGAGLAAGDDDVGLSAAVLVFVLFTVHFTFKLIAPTGGAPTSTT
ncbi:MAG TPA: hypothetical protein VGR12_05860 [Solirubrobacteraceae bacterium]|nr:hypothetical protein [Solirubrobacteraceae bacterium]